MAISTTHNQLLGAAFAAHRKAGHDAVQGANFVECAACQFHVHIGATPSWGGAMGNPCLWKHWKTGESFDPIPIVSTDDARLQVKEG